jgi:hypothetical protein
MGGRQLAATCVVSVRRSRSRVRGVCASAPQRSASLAGERSPIVEHERARRAELRCDGFEGQSSRLWHEQSVEEDREDRPSRI